VAGLRHSGFRHPISVRLFRGGEDRSRVTGIAPLFRLIELARRVVVNRPTRWRC
jgi:hypothetical protein